MDRGKCLRTNGRKSTARLLPFLPGLPPGTPAARLSAEVIQALLCGSLLPIRPHIGGDDSAKGHGPVAVSRARSADTQSKNAWRNHFGATRDFWHEEAARIPDRSALLEARHHPWPGPPKHAYGREQRALSSRRNGSRGVICTPRLVASRNLLVPRSSTTSVVHRILLHGRPAL
jgi:hypothetical protein